MWHMLPTQWRSRSTGEAGDLLVLPECLWLSCLESHTVCARHVPPNIHLSHLCQCPTQIPLSDVWASHKDRLGWSSSPSVTERLCCFWYPRKCNFHNCGFKNQHSFCISLYHISGTLNQLSAYSIKQIHFPNENTCLKWWKNMKRGLIFLCLDTKISRVHLNDSAPLLLQRAAI